MDNFNVDDQMDDDDVNVCICYISYLTIRNNVFKYLNVRPFTHFDFTIFGLA